MPGPDKNSKPHLAAGCRWVEANGSERMLMFPEGALRLQGTGREILERCDGQRSIQEIIDELQAQYKTGDGGRIEQEVSKFLVSLQQKRIVDF
ncbi:MAG TPA: pyrroloquinoline quinone biosynthesis peptide chaperone PqqD [Terriglobales bacterium]|jgi:pyrroloquinoline quinone biosynthesis protein D|nr:pyrroloquinoline quinone biosynthesis peptide chaperone PqqD [Terriglobales bacterium]